ncbi:hypothetical protein RhiirC2_791753 [Rhizophagus irregularis]|uniref:Hsp70 family protein n=1 Tax=Rhizophagus irregularis TaxID=588596 RepID=A0A2N1MIK6_9GLOM|nr:hypothetical protein RhiirC2_791753 [Rhizophagus irregularis]
MDLQKIRILVAIDFGTTHSSFAYVHIENPETIVMNSTWPGREGVSKIPTALEYNETYIQVINWGDLELDEELDDTVDLNKRSCPIELFKLHLSNLREDQKPWLPPQLNYKKAIEDYLTQMRILIKSTLERMWPTISFPQQVGLILTIPAEWPPHNTTVMRECAYKAGLLTTLNSTHLEFTTEPEAIALCCLNVVKGHNLHYGDSFLVADCGDDTEFLHFLERKVGIQALEKLKQCEYGQVQCLIKQFFSTRIRFKFNEDRECFRTCKLNLQQYCPDIQEYVTGEFKEQMEEAGWIIKLDFESVKRMFDPVVDRIIKLIDGEFSKSPYLLSRVKKAFIDQVPIIALPTAAVVRGAIIYGLNVKPTHDLSNEASSVHRIYDELDNLNKIKTVSSRVFEKTYGIKATRKWNPSDPIERKLSDGMINIFLQIAKQGNEIPIDTGISMIFSSNFISRNSIDLFITDEHDVKYCDSPGVNLIGTLKISTPSTIKNSAISITLFFSNITIKVVAQEVDDKTGWKYETLFNNISY